MIAMAGSEARLPGMRILPLLVLACTTLSADVANMSGNWALNVKRSTWRDKPSPVRVDLVIQHNEPAFKYSGTAQAPDERDASTFEFSGAIDEKEYPVKENGNASRKARFKRTADNTVEGVYIGPDGKTAESTRTTLSRDGKTLVRRVQVKLPDGRVSTWTEVYEKK
jgi:hypothetical protein